jgi:hypothetical protein
MSCKHLILFVSIVLFSVATIAATGCGSGQELGGVTGRITKDGKAVPNLWVEFSPAAGRPAEGRTNSDGHYELSYTSDRKGAKPGKNVVRISSGGEYDDRGNELSPRKQVHTAEVEVESGSNELNFEIE